MLFLIFTQNMQKFQFLNTKAECWKKKSCCLFFQQKFSLTNGVIVASGSAWSTSFSFSWFLCFLTYLPRAIQVRWIQQTKYKNHSTKTYHKLALKSSSKNHNKLQERVFSLLKGNSKMHVETIVQWLTNNWAS